MSNIKINIAEINSDFPDMHDDIEFVAAWKQMEDAGYMWSESNIEKAYLGWCMARQVFLS